MVRFAIIASIILFLFPKIVNMKMVLMLVIMLVGHVIYAFLGHVKLLFMIPMNAQNGGKIKDTFINVILIE